MITDTRDIIKIVLKNNYKKIYLAHSENIRAEGIARNIKDTLSKKGIECFVGADYRKKGEEAIRKAIEEAEVLFTISIEEGIAG
ncbi:hypothetical protein ES705_43226 [subsurface metagenome]